MTISRLRVLGAVAGLACTLTACAAPVHVEPAPEASTPVCAEILLAVPEELAGAQQRSTTSQASTAWGDPAITLRCGVTPPGPTTERCITAEGEDGRGVDWVVAELGSVEDEVFQFTTYGRVPAIELVVPVQYAAADPTTLLVDLGEAVELTEAQRQCF